MTFYSNLAKVVLRLMKSKGQTMYLLNRTMGTYSTTTSSATPTQAREAVFGVELPIEQSEQLDQAAQRTRKRFYLEAINPSRNPESFDALEVNGTAYEIMSCTALSPAGSAVLYEVVGVSGG